MRRLKDVLRLRFELDLSHRQIARSCDIGLGTVHDYLQRADKRMDNWLGAHLRAFEFYGGVPKLIVPDNAKTGVNKPAAAIRNSSQPVKRWRCTAAWRCAGAALQTARQSESGKRRFVDRTPDQAEDGSREASLQELYGYLVSVLTTKPLLLKAAGSVSVVASTAELELISKHRRLVKSSQTGGTRLSLPRPGTRRRETG